QEAQARLEQAITTQKRLQDLGVAKAVSQDEIQRAMSDVQILRAQLDAKKAELAEAEVRLAQARRRLEVNAVTPPEKAKMPPRGNTNLGDFKIFRLKNADAHAMNQVLGSILQGKGLRIVADQRTNSIIATGNEADLVILEALLNRLDE